MSDFLRVEFPCGCHRDVLPLLLDQSYLFQNHRLPAIFAKLRSQQTVFLSPGTLLWTPVAVLRNISFTSLLKAPPAALRSVQTLFWMSNPTFGESTVFILDIWKTDDSLFTFEKEKKKNRSLTTRTHIRTFAMVELFDNCDYNVFLFILKTLFRQRFCASR